MKPPPPGPLAAVVVDASVAVKGVLREEDSEAVAARLRAVASSVPLPAPPLLRHEIANALLRFHRRRRLPIAPEELERRLGRALEVVTVVLDPPGILPLAAKHGLSQYDAAYLALALDSGRGVKLWTFDASLAEAARKEGVLATDEHLDG